MDIYQLQRQLFRDVTDRESVAFSRVLNAYREALFESVNRFDIVARLIEERIASGNTAIVALELERFRLNRFIVELREILAVAAGASVSETATYRARLAEFGDLHANLLLENGAAAAKLDLQFNRVSLPAIQALIGQLDAQSPLAELFNSITTDGATKIGKLIEQSIIAGENPRDLGRHIRDQFDVSTQRALTIARTESMRAYRGATQENYRLNARFLRGWRWSASLSDRTCAACIASHGTEHPIEEPFGSHPNCRCSPIPIVIGDDRPFVSGPDWFSKQDKSLQRKVLNRKGLAIYESGTPLTDWVHETTDPRWGRSRQARTPKSN